MKSILKMFPAVLILTAAGRVDASCGAAVCSLNTSWDTQGVWTEPGLRLDLRFEYIDQDKLRDRNNDAINAGPPGTHDESRTINRNYIMSLDYSWHPRWGVNVTLPWYNRDHMNADDPPEDESGTAAIRGSSAVTQRGTGAGNKKRFNPAGHEVEIGPEGRRQDWSYEGIGDLQVVGRYQIHSGIRSGYGVNFGAKFPTAPRKKRGDDGLNVDRSVNPGTGSWDAIVGAYLNGQLSDVSSGFVNTRFQLPVVDDGKYDPGATFSMDLGYRRNLPYGFSFIPQLNTTVKENEGGDEGLPDNSGGVFVYLSPGLGYDLTRNSQLFGFLQLPVYRNLDGPQVVADWAFAFGMSIRH